MVDNSLQPNRSEKLGSERDGRSAPISYTDSFYEQFPYYLSIGMTAKQYWEDDCTLVKYYRKADEYRMERINQQAWLQGMYIYDALSRLSPILKAFPKKGTKAEPYPEEPYALNQEKEEEVRKKKQETAMQKGIQFMEAFASKTNKRFEEKE